VKLGEGRLTWRRWSETPAEAEGRRRAATIRRWQRVRNRAWANANDWFFIGLLFGSRPTDTDMKGPKWAYAVAEYEAKAGDARARGEWVPTLDELRVAETAGPAGPVAR
jgi:hypothetical protein